MYDDPDAQDGIPPHTAAMAVAVMALLGIGLYAASVWTEKKSPDPLYDLDRPESRTSSKVMETPDLWKKKEPAAAPDAPPSMPMQAPVRPVRPSTSAPVTP